jgi:16S rRNA (adenine1518-N6/adenine1519-N6)-dimethyltransferase
VTDLLGAAALRDVLRRHGVRPTKGLGQNFVIDPNTIRKMIAVAAPETRDVVLEIGPGAGSLTLGLAKRAGRVVAVEKDPKLVAILRETLSGLENVRVVTADALDLDLSQTGATTLVANLPYNVAATLVIRVLEQAPEIETLTVMTQREVGERLAASPGSKTYGRSSVMVALFGSAEMAGRVSRRAFWPVPNVDSVIVRIERLATPLHHDVERFSSLVEACFSSRRKTVRNGIVTLTQSSQRAESILRAAGVDSSARPEVLSPLEFAAMTDAYRRTNGTD